VDWLPLTNDGDVATAPQSLLELLTVFFGVRACDERKAVFAIV
jgi:hypothetical protein